MDDDSLFDPVSMQGVDPVTMAGLLQGLPAIQQQQRRVKQLRGVAQQFQDMQNQPGNGNYVPAQQGGLFPTVQQRIPDYAGAGNKIVGALGSYLGTRAANNEEDAYNANRDQAVLRGVQQMSSRMGQGGDGGGPMTIDGQTPTAATMRAYLNLIGGPDMKDIIGQIPHVQSNYVDQDTGHVIALMSDGSQRDLGNKKDMRGTYTTDAQGNRVWLPSMASGQGQGRVATVGGTQNAPNVQPQGGGQNVQPTGFDAIDAGVAQREGGLVADDAGKGASNFGINQAAHPDIDVTKLTAQQAQQIRHQYWDQIGGDNLPPAIQNAAYDTAINMGVDKAKELIDASGGDPQKFRQLRGAAYADLLASDPQKYGKYAQSWFDRNNQTTQGGPATATVVSGPNGTAGAVNTGGPGQPVHVATNYEKGYQTQTGKQAAETEYAPTKMTDKAIGAQIEKQAVNRGALLDALPGARDSLHSYLTNLQKLRNHPGLKYVVGSTNVFGNASDAQLADDSFARKALVTLALKDPQAASQAREALNLYNNVKADASFQGLTSLRGSLSRPTQAEWAKEGQAQTMLTRDLDIPEFQAETDRMANKGKRHYKTAYDEAHSTVKPINVSVPGSRSIAAGQQQGAGQPNQDEMDLVNQYLNEGQ